MAGAGARLAHGMYIPTNVCYRSSVFELSHRTHPCSRVHDVRDVVCKSGAASGSRCIVVTDVFDSILFNGYIVFSGFMIGVNIYESVL